MLEEKEYRKFDAVIEKINKHYISPDPNICKQYKEAFEDFLKRFREKLCEKEPILNLYKKIHYTGSVYEGLYVGPEFKEFDMNLCLHFPAHFTNVKRLSHGGYALFQLDVKNNYDENIRKTINSWLDEEKYVVATKFYNWGKGAVDKILNSLPKNGSKCIFYNYWLSHKQSGPAYTIGVEKMGTDIKFDVDIVLAFEFHIPPPGIQNISCRDWLLVAKSPKVKDESAYKLWRMSFPDAEKTLIDNKMKLKNIIRLIKKIRDKENLHYIASYHIKSVFFDFIPEVSDYFWEQKSLGYLLRIMLDELLNSLKNGIIRFNWDIELNLIADLDKGQLHNAANKIQSVIKNMDKNLLLGRYDDIKYILLTPEEVINYDQENDDQIQRSGYGQCPDLSSSTVSSIQEQTVTNQVQDTNTTATILPVGIGVGVAVGVAAVGLFAAARYFFRRDD